ncbi:Polyketide synthase PksJ [Legionella maceachernii]|uniref:condensation domain-containing protein n=1 Tax=Legionella maceachernii TaxID=466 RepID=UPI000DF93C3E|nr:condensation domain-containing protein [Legionella maceachernii]SUP03195.1 Polyketide synthase PksJ [Legionella maceachernii]
MKSLYQLYDELLAKDIKIAVKGSNLHLTGNKSALTPELIAALTAQKEPLVSWLTEKQDQDLGLPTTAGQRALWSLSRLHNNEIHNLVKTFRLNKELKQEQLSTSLLQLIQSHRVLRSVYRSDKDQELRQFRLPSVEFQITTIHSTLENLSTDLKAYVDVPFDLSKELPLRAAIFKAEDQRYFVLVVHHIAVDHSAYQILLEQLATLVSGESLSIEDNYERFIHEQSKYNSSPEKVADRLFWQESFQELTRRQDQPQEINSTDYHYFSFDEYELQPALKAFARDNGLTPYSLFLAVFNLLQFFSTGEPNVIVATPALNRNVLWSKKIIGFLANVIPIPTVIDEQQSLQSCCQQLAQTIVQGLSHQSLALSEMTKTKSALATQAMFVWHQDVSQAMQLFRQHIGEELFLLPSIRGIHEPILLIISPTAESYHFELYFNRSLFKKTEAEFWIQQFKLVYRQLIINAQQNVEQLFIAQLAAAEMLPPLARYEHADFYRQSLNRLMVTRTTPADLVRFCYELLHNHCVINDELYDTTIFERQFLKANNKIKSCKLISKKHKEGGWHNVMYFVADELLDTRSLPAEIQAIQVYQFPLLDNGDCAWHALEQEACLKEDDKQYILEKIRQATGFSDVKLLTREQMNASALLHLHEFSQQNDSVVANQHYLTLEQEAAGPQALVHGPELIIPSQAPITLTEAFCLTAKQFPEKGIYHYNRKGVYFQSYGSLYQRALHILSGLQARGLKPQNKIILQIPNLADHLAVFWAAILGGIIPVTVAIPPNYSKSNAVVEKLLHVWLLLEQPLLISGQANQVEVAQLTELYPGMDFKVETVEQLEYPTASELIYSAKPTDVVFYQLTSGSTGKPKCIQETHRGIIAHIHGSSQTNGYRKEDICLNWLPLDHVVPILTYHLKNVYLGCTQIEVLTELIIAEPLLWLDLIEKHAVTHSWSPNFGFKLLSEALKKEHGKTWQLASLKKLMNAGEQVTKLVCDLFLHRVARYGVEQAVMQPAFGMAEACTCMTYLNDYSSSTSTLFIKKTSLSGHLELSEEGDDAIGFVNLGTVMPGVAIRITDAQNRILPELVIGRFQIHGAVITPGYYANSAANQEAFQEDGWFDSGDLGFIYQGCLYLTGRQKETIIINGTNFYCYEIEDLVNTLPGVKPTFTAACGVPDRDSGSETLALFFVPESSDPDEQLQTIIQIRQSVSKHLAVFARHIIPLTLDDFKKTTSGKIQRQEMKNNFLKGGYPQSIQLDKHFLTKEVIPDWFYKQKWRLSKDLIRENPESRIHFISLKDLHHVERTETAPENGRALIPAISQYVRDDGDSWGFLDIKSGPHNKTYIENQAIIVVDLTRTSLAIESIYDGLLKLYQSLSPLTLNGLSLQLYVFTYKKFQVVEGDSEQSMYSGLASLLKTMSLETTALHCRLIDIDDIPALATILKQEAGALTRRNLVAYRSSQRYALSLCKIIPPSDNNNKILFKTKGFYLVIGGLGGSAKNYVKSLVSAMPPMFLSLEGKVPRLLRQNWTGYAIMASNVHTRLSISMV